MKMILGLLLVLLTAVPALGADVKISALPLGSAATAGLNDSFPFVSTATGVTKRMTLYDIANLPSIASQFAALSGSPTFTGPVTAPHFYGPLTGNVTGVVTGSLVGNASTATALAANPTDCASGAYAVQIDVGGNLTCASVAFSQLTGSISAAQVPALLITNGMLAGSIADSKLSTISTAGKVSNSATTATDANTASAIVARDASGNFTAGMVTASLTGNVTGNVSGSAGSFTSALSGEVSGTQSSTVLSNAAVIGKVLTGLTTTAGTPTATDSILSAIGKNTGQITTNTSNIALKAPIASPTFTGTATAPTFSGNLTGNVTGNVSGSAGSFTGSLVGDVTGTQGATVVGKINGTSLSGLATGILKNTTTTGVPSIAIAADFPTLNQNTTGTASNITGTTNSTLTTLSSLSLPTSQLSGSVTNSQLSAMSATTIKGNSTGGSATPTDLSATAVTAMLNAMVGDSGSGGTKGLVPAPASGDAAAGKVLKADGTWGSAGTSSPLTTNGDLYYYNSTNARLPIGTNGFILSVVSSLPSWITAPFTTVGSTVKSSQSTIDINGQAQILSGTVDPTATATSAPIGSIYLNSSTGTAYRKTDAGSSTNWANLAIGSIQQAYAAGSLRITGCTGWVRNSSTYGGFGTTTGCSYVATGNVLAPSTMVPGFRVQNMAPGTYMFVVRAEVIQTTTNVSAGVSIRFTDGTNTFSEQSAGDMSSTSGQATTAGVFNGSYTYATAQPTTSFEIQEKNSAGSVTLSVGNGFSISPAIDAMTVDVYYFPTSSQVVQPTAQTLDTLGQVNYVLGATCPSGSVAADGSAISRSTYAALFNRVGTTYGAGNGSTTFNVPDLRGIFVRGAGTNGTYTNANGVAYSGTLAAEQNDQFQGHSVNGIANGGATAVAAGATSVPLLSAVGSVSPITDGSNGTPRTGVETRPANMSLTPCISNATMAMPVIANSVTSASSGVEVVNRAYIANNGSTCSVASQSGSWITSATRVSAGRCDLTVTGFSATPTCTFSQDNLTTPIFVTGRADSTSTSVKTNTITAASVFTDSNYFVICMGPK